MNGLKYIRTRCNLSLGELANAIGVTRQALSSWENERKKIPKQRKQELADFFGIDKVYFDELSEENKKYLLEKAMFRYEENGKETYRYMPKNDEVDLEHKLVSFFEDSELSLDEKFVLAQKQKKDMLQKIEDIITWTDNAGGIQSQICCINRGCEVYGIITKLMQTMREQKNIMKMPFYADLMNVWKAMLVGYDLLEETELGKNNFGDENYYGDDVEWIMTLAQEIKDHWNKKYLELDQIDQDIKSQIRAKRNKVEEEPKLSVEEFITEVEKRHKEALHLFPSFH